MMLLWKGMTNLSTWVSFYTHFYLGVNTWLYFINYLKINALVLYLEVVQCGIASQLMSDVINFLWTYTLSKPILLFRPRSCKTVALILINVLLSFIIKCVVISFYLSYLPILYYYVYNFLSESHWKPFFFCYWTE